MAMSEETRAWLRKLGEAAKASLVPLRERMGGKKADGMGGITAGQGKMCSVSGNMM